MFAKFENGELHARLDEYSEANIEFHQSIISKQVLISLAENLFTQTQDLAQDHRRAGSRRSLHPRPHVHHRGDRGPRHQARRGSVREHAPSEHVEKYADYLD
jgi:hypothetical protein